jgi:uncharacterized phosphosugar-binding protein
MSAERWFALAEEVLSRIRITQADSLRRAATRIADSAAAGGALHIYDTGHCSREPIHRAGGLLLLKDFQLHLNLVSAPGPKRAAAAAERQKQLRGAADEELADLAVRRSGLAPGDVLIVNSVSGKAPLPVQVALSAKRLGVTVVAITNVAYSSAVQSLHSSGKRLFEVADVAIDNCGMVGDAALDMEGLDARAVPTSGLTFCYIIWALTAEAISQMVARGLKPHVYRSVNLPDGEEFNARAEAEYRETGV